MGSLFQLHVLAAVSSENDEYEEMLRHNTHLALRDSSIFLVPHVPHVQALALLAIHGEDCCTKYILDAIGPRLSPG
jgi:hypothetical protein